MSQSDLDGDMDREQVRATIKQLVDIRKANGMTQKYVGALMGIGQQSVSTLETGDQSVRLSTLQRYARAVGADLTVEVVPDEETDYVVPK